MACCVIKVLVFPPHYSCLLNILCDLSRQWRLPQYASALCKLTFDLLTLKVVSESHVTWATSLPILVFLGLSVSDVRDRQTSDVFRRQMSDAHHRLMPPLYRGGGIIITRFNVTSRRFHVLFNENRILIRNM